MIRASGPLPWGSHEGRQKEGGRAGQHSHSKNNSVRLTGANDGQRGKAGRVIIDGRR